MGGTATVGVVGDACLLVRARRRIEDLEARWSRFRPTSDVARLNASRDRPVRVSDDTQLLVERSKEAWSMTSGAFDPTVHDSLVAWGYDRDLPDVRPLATRPPCETATGPDDIVVDRVAGTVVLGGCSGFDGGGIGKGLAADLVASELVAQGATSAVVDVGGDVRVAGTDPWTVGVEDPLDSSHDLLRLSVSEAGLATSSDRRRRWPVGAGAAHHLIDPRTGAPADTPLAGVTVLAGEAWWAEALTKAVLVGGLPVGDLGASAASGISRTSRGDVQGTPDLLELVRGAA